MSPSSPSSSSPPLADQGKAEKDRWLGAWQEPEKPRFDAGRSSPALVRLLQEALEDDESGGVSGDSNSNRGGGGVFCADGRAAVRSALLPRGTGETAATTTATRILVPGCGRGYDVATLAAAAARAVSAREEEEEKEGPDREKETSAASVVVGWDYVPEAVRSAREWLSTQGDIIGRSSGRSSIRVEVEEADFFERARQAAAAAASSSSSTPSPQSFALAYDYTFFCALPPASRPDWARAYASLLRDPGSVLITQIFPSVPAPGRGVEELPDGEREAFLAAFRSNEPEAADAAAALRAAEGPPWPVSPECYERVLSSVGFDLVSCDAVPATLSHRGRGGREFLAVWRRRREEEEKKKRGEQKLSAL